MSINDSNIWNGVIGGTLFAFGLSLFYLVHHEKINLGDTLWALTSFREKLLPEYLPLISGLFFIAGLFFDIFSYNSMNSITPYGDKNGILTRTSMYGFALSGLLIGVGSKLSHGDFFFHACQGIALKNKNSIILALIIFLTAVLSAWLGNNNHLGLLADGEINPQMEFIHNVSANICIAISIILLIIAGCWKFRQLQDYNSVFQHLGGSWMSGILLGLGWLIPGFSNRLFLLNCLSPGVDWKPTLIIFLGVAAVLKVIFYHILVKKLVSQQVQDLQPSYINEGLRINKKAVFGAVCVGFSWGLGAIDFMTYLIHSAIFSFSIVIIFGGFLIIGLLFGDLFQ